MHKKQTLALTGIGMIGAAVLLAGCGGSSLSSQNLATRPNTLPYIYGLEPIAYYGAANANGTVASIEGSGFQAASGGQAFITGDTAFTATTALGATLPVVADPNTTGTLPTVFSAKGQYVDAVSQTTPTAASVMAVPAGTSVFFRAAIANGLANNTTASPITGATLTSTDAELAPVAGLTTGLPLSFLTTPATGAFSNATYVTGTGGTATPFTIPASTTAGLHTVVATVTDSAGRVTSTTFIFPVVTPATVCLFAQNITADGQTATPAVATPIGAGDTVTIDGAAGTGTYPAGFTPNKADPQGTVVFFVAPGTHTLVDTTPVAATSTTAATTKTTTQTIIVPASAAGTTIIQ